MMNPKEAAALGRLVAIAAFYKQGEQNMPSNPDLGNINIIRELIDIYTKEENYDPTLSEKIIRNRIKQIDKTVGLGFLPQIDAGIYHNSLIFSKIVQGYAREQSAIEKGIRFRAYRKNANLTIIEMAALLNINPKNIQAWEAHKRDLPDNIFSQLQQAGL